MKKHLLFSCLFLSAIAIAQTGFAAPLCSYVGHYSSRLDEYEGPTQCNSVKLDSLTVRGILTTHQTTVSGRTGVSGTLEAYTSVFSDITMEKNGGIEKIYLKDNSIVKGDINFIGLKGIVYIDASSKILGKVSNADVVNQA